jgi:hypothetical protein
MEPNTLVEINELTAPYRNDSRQYSITVNVNGVDCGVTVCDIDTMNTFPLVLLTKQLVLLLDLHANAEYVGGMFKINGVFHRTDIVCGVHSGKQYLRHVRLLSIPNAVEEIENGNVYLSAIEYPELYSEISESIASSRFYQDAETEINKALHRYRPDGTTALEAMDLFKHNQYNVFQTTYNTVMSMDLLNLSTTLGNFDLSKMDLSFLLEDDETTPSEGFDLSEIPVEEDNEPISDETMQFLMDIIPIEVTSDEIESDLVALNRTRQSRMSDASSISDSSEIRTIVENDSPDTSGLVDGGNDGMESDYEPDRSALDFTDFLGF